MCHLGILLGFKWRLLNCPWVSLHVSYSQQGLQVASKQKINPWDTLEAYKSPAPLSWSFFGAVRMERKPLKYQEQFRLTHYHTHTREKPDDYYFQPPQLPPDEEEPPQPISHNEVEKVAMESGTSLSESSKGEGSSGGTGETTINTTTSKKRKRNPRKKTPTPSQQIREVRISQVKKL